MSYTNKNTALKNIGKYDFNSPLFDNFRDDKEVVIAALIERGTKYSPGGLILSRVSDRLKDDKEVVTVAISVMEDSIEHASDRLKDDKEIIIGAVKCYGGHLTYATDRLRDDKEVALAAMNSISEKGALYYVSDRLKDDKEVVLAAIKCDYENIRWASDRLKNDPELILVNINSYILNKSYGNFEYYTGCFSKELRSVLSKNTSYSGNSSKLDIDSAIADFEKMVLAEKLSKELKNTTIVSKRIKI